MALPEKMQALVLRHDGFSGTQEGPALDSLDPYLEAREIDVPQPGPGQALIRVIRATINPSDLHFIKGEYGLPRRAGVPAGFEAVGEVVAAGEGGEGLIGMRVSFLASASGAWAEYAMADAATCVPLRPDVRDEDAAALLVNPLTAIAMFEEVKQSGTESFIMTAAASQLCKLIAGLAKEDDVSAISLVRHDEQIAMLKELGAAHVLNATNAGFMEEMAGLIKQEKPRVMLDAVADQISSDVFFAMPSCSRWMVYGKLSPTPPVLTQMGQFIFMDKHIEGFWLSKWMQLRSKEDQVAAITRVQELFASGAWNTDVAETIPLKDAHAAVPGALAKMNTGKVMLVP